MAKISYEDIILSSGSTWTIANVIFTELDIQHASEQATKKSRFTMNADQAGNNRTSLIKYQRQLMGILAEIGCKAYLEDILSEYDDITVERYDDVRTDEFKSPKGEYDIKILIRSNNIEIIVESRSSITHNKSLLYGIENYDIIGPYSSVAKSQEKDNNLYLRPLYSYIHFERGDYYDNDFDKLLSSQEVSLHIVAGCSNFRMCNPKASKLKNMGQYGTLYRVVPIQNASDARKFAIGLTELIKK